MYIFPELLDFHLKDIKPIQETFSSSEFKSNKTIMLFPLGNGKGKTTVCDLIEFSFLKSLIGKRHEIYHSRVPKGDTGEIITTWLCKNIEIKFKQILYPSGITKSIISNDPINAVDYNQNFFKFTGIPESMVRNIYTSLYYIKENDSFDIFGNNNGIIDVLDNLASIIQMSDLDEGKKNLQHRIKMYTNAINDLKRKIADLRLEREKRLNLPFSTLELYDENIKIYETKLQEEEKNLDSYRLQEEEIWSSHQTQPNDFLSIQDVIETVNKNKNEKIKEREQIQKELDNLNNLKEKNQKNHLKDFMIPESLASCPVCFKNIIEHQNVRDKDVCPYCGIDLEENDINENEIETKINLCFQRISTLTNDIQSLDSDLINKKDELLSIKHQLNSIQDQIKAINVERDRTRNSLFDIRRKLENYKEGREIFNRIDNVSDEEEKISTELKEKEEQLKKAQKKYNEFKESKRELINEIKDLISSNFKKFVKKFLNITGEVKLYNRLIENDEETIYFEGISYSQKFIFDLIFRISIWEALIIKDMALNGTLIIDFPSVIDKERLNIITSIINYLSQNGYHIVFAYNPTFNTFKFNNSKTTEFRRHIYQSSLLGFLQ